METELVECRGIKFGAMTYWYEELLGQMQSAGLSPWINKWNMVNDLSPSPVSAFVTSDIQSPTTKNFVVASNLNWIFIPPLGEIYEKISKVKENKPSVQGIQDVTETDLSMISLQFDEEYEIMSGLFDVGPYFNVYSQNIIKGIIPSGQFKGSNS